MNKAILLEKRPVGLPQLSDFTFVSNDIDTITTGELLLKTSYVSVDPYLRSRMNDAKSYIPAFELHKPISSGIIAEVIDSKNTAFEKGDFVSGMLEWKEFQKSNGEGLLKVDASKAPLSAYLGVLGLTGLTAYLGLTEIGKPKKGETIVVSGAAGAVGSIVGQIAKLYGCKVISIAGTDDKVTMLKSSLGFDEAINYNTTKNMTAAIKEAAPNGVNIYFDNVGGPISDAVLLNIRPFARFIICGAISVYNNTELPKSISVQPFLIKNSALMQGFIVFNYAEKYPEAIKQISQWLAEGKLSYTETIVEGFDAIPQTFLDLFEGKNKGKMLVKI